MVSKSLKIVRKNEKKLERNSFYSMKSISKENKFT